MAQSILAKLAVQLLVDASKMGADVSAINKRLSGLETAAMRLKSTLIGTFGAYQVINAIQNSVRTLAEFDKTMTAVRVITGAAPSDFNKLEQSALKLGSTTQYTAKQVAELQLEFGRLGFSTREILQSTKATVDLATATGESLARSAEIAGSTLRAFQIDTREMSRVTDVMAAALNNSALTLDTFADSIKYVSPVAKATGVTLEETAAMLSVLADAGIKGSQAGTSLRRIFTMLTKEGGTLQERLQQLADKGITLADANDEVGLYAQTALLQLSAMLPRVQELTKEFNASRGSTEQMARAMEENLGTAITKVGTAWDSLILSFKGSKGFLKSFFDEIAENLRLIAGGEGADLLKFSSLLKASQASIIANNNVRKGQFENLLLLADKLGKELIIIRDSTGKISAIYENLRTGVLGPPKAETDNQIIGAQKMLELLRERAKKEQENTDELKKQNEEYQKLIDKGNEYFKMVNRWEMTAINRREFFATRKITKPDTPNADAFLATPEDKLGSIFEIRQRQMDAFYEGIKKLKSGIEEADSATNDFSFSWERLGFTAANVLSNIIAADQDMGMSVKRVVADILRANAQQIASWLAVAFAKDSATKTPAWAVASLAAAIGVISGLLGKEWRSGRSAPSPRAASRTEGLSGGIQNSVVIRGQDLYITMSNYMKNNKSTTFTLG